MPEITIGSAVPFVLPTTSGEVVGTTDGEYLGLSVTAVGEAATITLYDASSLVEKEELEAKEPKVVPPVIERIAIASGASANFNYPRPGRKVLHGIYAAITGKPAGSVFQ